MIRKTLLTILSVLLTVTLLIIPFANVSELMSGTQSGKSFYFAFAMPNEAKQHLNNTILYTCLGNNYKALGDWRKIIENGEAEILNKNQIQRDNNLDPIHKETILNQCFIKIQTL